MANLSKASNVVQERYILYDVTGFTQKWHSIPVATNCMGVLYCSLVLPGGNFELVKPIFLSLPVQSRWTAGGPEWTLRSLGGEQGRRSGDVAHGNDGSVGALYRVGSVHIVANIRRVQV